MQKTGLSHLNEEIEYAKINDQNYALTQKEWANIFAKKLDLSNDF
jgi:hypothetical protein